MRVFCVELCICVFGCVLYVCTCVRRTLKCSERCAACEAMEMNPLHTEVFPLHFILLH